jgi:hypothetical protein
MGNSYVKEQAYADIELLDRVVQFKDRFYPAGSAHYNLAKPGTMKLMPPESCLNMLVEDYNHMANMIFGDIPSFEDIIDSIQKMEQEINSIINTC